ncbi:MAG: toll/interleukin-1 receptor domain-containing protein [Oscillospiraceae bacterium]|nr:toll/interleukin-1 receptor domain-containing protein [Oscillospiraceae bacterium]
MSGVTKSIYNHEVIDIIKMWDQQIKTIEGILPQNYTIKNIIDILKDFYPHEWNSVQAKYEYYYIKDKHLKRIKNKYRYNMLPPEQLIKKSQSFKKITSKEYQLEYSKNYNKDVCYEQYNSLKKKRQPKIEKINSKIEKAKQKTQQVTPDFLEKLIGLYNRKNTSQKDKMYIIVELKKYYNSQVIQFFFKLNDTEINKQLREIAFHHLQSFNYQPRLRGQKHMQIHTKSKKTKDYLKNEYAFQTYKIPFDPDELEYRINNSFDQKIKNYDFFISHSSKDSKYVQKLITHLNRKGENVYCDWISDSDYLKRHLVRQATLNVIKTRLEQSKKVVFVDSEYSTHSLWCKYELNYFYELKKPIYYIKTSDIERDNYNIILLRDKWFFDNNYRNIPLLEQ